MTSDVIMARKSPVTYIESDMVAPADNHALSYFSVSKCNLQIFLAIPVALHSARLVRTTHTNSSVIKRSAKASISFQSSSQDRYSAALTSLNTWNLPTTTVAILEGLKGICTCIGAYALDSVWKK